MGEREKLKERREEGDIQIHWRVLADGLDSLELISRHGRYKTYALTHTHTYSHIHNNQDDKT